MTLWRSLVRIQYRPPFSFDKLSFEGILLDYKYAYLIGDLLLALIWLLFFIRRSDLRKEMLVLGLLVSIATPLSELLYIKDYWKPEFIIGDKFGVEDIIFGITAGGIGAVIYEEIFRRGFFNRHSPRHPWFMLIIPLLVFLGMYILQKGFGINSIYGTYIAFLALALMILILRRDLLREALLSAILLTTLVIPIYLIWQFLYPDLFPRFWQIKNLSGKTFYGIPIEELMIYPPFGMICGTLYEFITGFGDRRLPSYNKKRL